MNENLRQALIRARLREEDVAARLSVDPKTVRRWIDGRVPYAANRAALAVLLEADETELWPDVSSLLTERTRPEELARVYPQRWAIPRETWARFFSSAQREIGILAYSALFLAEDTGLLRILADKGFQGIKVRVALGDPDSPQVAERGADEGIGASMPAKVRNALVLFDSLRLVPNIELRLHRAVLYNSIYQSDDRLLVNQHIYGIHAAQAPVYQLNITLGGEMSAAYAESFNRIWSVATPSSRPSA